MPMFCRWKQASQFQNYSRDADLHGPGNCCCNKCRCQGKQETPATVFEWVRFIGGIMCVASLKAKGWLARTRLQTW
jgi:hypothetical protein